MKPPRKLQAVLSEALVLARGGRTLEAVSALEVGLKRAKSVRSAKWIVSFSRNLGLLADSSGNLRRARRYYELAREYDPSDAGIHYVLSDVYRRLGLSGLSVRAIERSKEEAIAHGDHELVASLGGPAAHPRHDRRNRSS
jgi:tetratricopeptide (TPR) repeat protein